MQPSKHNIIAPITGTELSVIVNLLSENADVIESSRLDALTSGRGADDQELIDKGYVVDLEHEAKRYREAYLSFVEGRDTDEI